MQLGVVDPGGQTQSGGPPDCGRHTVSSGQETVEQMPSVGKRKDHTRYMCDLSSALDPLCLWAITL